MSSLQPTAPTTTTATLAMPATSAVALPHPHPHPHPLHNKRFHTSPPASTTMTGRFPSSLMAVMNLDDGGADSALSSDDDDDDNVDCADDVRVGPVQEACRAAATAAPAAARAVAPISHGAPTSSASASVSASAAVFAAAPAAAVSTSPPLPSACVSVSVSASHALAPPMPMHAMPPTTGMTPAANGATPTHHAPHIHQHHPTAPLGHHHHHQVQHQHAPLAHPFHVAMPSAQTCTPPPPPQAQVQAQVPTQTLPLPWSPAGLHAQPSAQHHALPLQLQQQQPQQHVQYAPVHQQQYPPPITHAQPYPAPHAHHTYPAVSAPAPVVSSYSHQDASLSSYYRENPYRAAPPAPLHHAAAAAAAAAQPWSAAPAATSSSPRTSPPLPPPQATSWAPLADRADRDRPFPPPAAAAPTPTPHWDASRAASIDNHSSASASTLADASSQAASNAQPATPWEALLSVAAAESSSLDRQSESATSSSAESSPTSSARVRAVPTPGDVPALARVAPQVPTPAPTPTPPMHPAPRGHHLAPPHVTAAGTAPRRASWAPTSSTSTTPTPSAAAGTAPAVGAAAAAAAGTPESDILDRITWMPTGMPLVARAAGAPAILAALLTDGKAFRCIPCGQRFRRKADTVRHVRSLHTAEKPHICPACHRGFARVDALKRHLDTDPECAAKGIVRENARCNAVPVLSGASSRRRASVPAGVALARGDEAMVAALIGAAKRARGAGEAAVAPVSAE
ncbi:hypothetical protein GGF32_008169 [Allomyces javanicus]|nr:hypothetical protein GGF32_008169 [Allomyces javanicus]